ncbi:flagellar basal body-associated FliL family protein [Paenibacillus harenae]|uniref:Flagellar protein FliL n=1 Tax=Paenibacillus harenae TaxID=306543 RepID=A0ABT9U0D3_PAEHA|nr:flagellar basal body-associated FliL family protein [Paenibacillus harenae]MDQ0059669.1 flagellar FliL protein [Paenibacillus harenae]MDQ0113083.1 flagellar FliL protein [Paenibacillus harenae]
MKKMMPWLITILLSITLIAIVAVILFKSFLTDSETEAANKPVEVKVLSASERVEVTSELKEFRRNLLDPEYVVILSFAFQLDSKKAKEDFDKIMEIEVRPIINRAVADMTADELSGSKGEDALESKLLNLINPILAKGKLVKVEITNFTIAEI